MSHDKLLTIFLFLLFGALAKANSVCTLMEKNVADRKYAFKCNNEVVNIKCDDKNKLICGVTIKDKLRSMKFNVSDDEFKSLNLFSIIDTSKTTCDVKTRLCSKDGNTCRVYNKFTKEAIKVNSYPRLPQKHCNTLDIGKSVLQIGSFSGDLGQNSDFTKQSCADESNKANEDLKNKLAVFRKILDPSIMDRESFLYSCVTLPANIDGKNRDKIVASNANQLKELKNRILQRMNSSDQLKVLACREPNEIFFENDRLDVHTIMCAIFEEASLSMADGKINCSGEVVGDSIDAESDRFIASKAGARTAIADTTPIEQKPMPEAMASQIGKPVGLAPALAQVDQVVPGSGSVGTESNYAAGAVRNTIPTAAALQAGQAFAPVYEKLSTIGKSVGSSSTSVRQGVIGSGSPARSSATGVVTVTRKTPIVTNSDSSSSIADIAGTAAVGASAALTKTSAAADTGASKKPVADIGNDKRDETAPSLGGPRSLGLNSGGSSSGGSRSPSNSDVSASSDLGTSAAAVTVQKKITQLNTPAQIDSFFKKEAANIPNLRELLYSDATSKILASKGIRVVNQSGEESGETVAKAKYLYRDDGSKFTPLKLAKKN